MTDRTSSDFDLADAATDLGDDGATSRRAFLTNSAIVGGGALTLSLADLGIEEVAASQQGDTGVRFKNRPTDGRSVVIDWVLVSEGGFVAIHDASLFEGEVAGSVVGVTDFLEPGTHRFVTADLFDVPGGDFDRHRLSMSEPLVAMPHFDTNGNQRYDFVTSGGETDGPYTVEGGAAVDLAIPSMEAGVEISNQASNGQQVSVRDAILPDGGFVAIHDASLFEGDVTGSVVGVTESLDPGMHSAVQVDLFDVPGGDFDRSELSESQPLVAMPHLDTNGNGNYDFVSSQGNQDGPYTINGEPVVDLGFIEVE